MPFGLCLTANNLWNGRNSTIRPFHKVWVIERACLLKLYFHSIPSGAAVHTSTDGIALNNLPNREVNYSRSRQLVSGGGTRFSSASDTGRGDHYQDQSETNR